MRMEQVMRNAVESIAVEEDLLRVSHKAQKESRRRT